VTSPTKESFLYNQFLISSPEKSSSNGLQPQQSPSNLTFYLVVSLLSALSIVILVLSMLTLLSRSGRFGFFTDLLVKTPTKGSGSTAAGSLTSGASTMQQQQHHHHRNGATNKLVDTMLQYNQLLGICSSSSSSTAGTTSTTSGGSSPVWPGIKTYIDPHTYEDPTKIVSLFARELLPSHIIIESVIGGGEFGDVCKGRLRNTETSSGLAETVVAIKTLKGAATEQNRCDFLTEASIMAQFANENVIRLEGVVTQSQPLMIVIEFMENGSLDTYLRLNESKLKMTQLVRMLKDVSNGMRYLSDMNYIHRDLAARNILVTRSLTCKVADFGLSREIVDADTCEYTTKGGKIPIRWTAPEACTYRKYSCASDVWSFGVLAWEVLSFAERPYWNWDNKDVVRAVQEAMYRLPPPTNCPECLYKLMRHCWQEDRSRRPKFVEIDSMLEELLAKHLDELTRQARVKELLPINTRQPTRIQLTRSRQFLARIGLEDYSESFESAGYGNLANLFQLDANDLFYFMGIQGVLEQKRILDELKKVYESYTMGGGQASSQNSYNLSAAGHNTQHQHQMLTTLLRTSSMNKNAMMALVMQQQQQQQQVPTNPNDLLTFSTNTPTLPLNSKNGYLV
jgi:serine/threonine protein kinase